MRSRGYVGMPGRAAWKRWVVWSVCAAVFVLVVAVALLWYPPLGQRGYAVLSGRPFLGSVAASSSVAPAENELNVININTASLEELCLLPGIGEGRANAIIDYRVQNGPFKNLDELLDVSGIGPKTLDSLRDMASC